MAAGTGLRYAEPLNQRPWTTNPSLLRGYNHDATIEGERPSDGTGGHEARSQWFECLVRAGGDARRAQMTEDDIGKPLPPRSHMRALTLQCKQR